MVEIVGHTQMFDYVEFLGEYAPFDLSGLDDFCRAAELHGLGSIIKVDAEPRRFLAQRAIGAGFDGVLFADCRDPHDVEECVRAVKPDTPDAGGSYGVATRRSSFPHYGGTREYVEALSRSVVLLMIEKRSAVEKLDEILGISGIDIVQWGPADYAMSIGKAGETDSRQVRDAERQVLEMCREAGVPARAEIDSVEGARRYLDLGVRHFCLGSDLHIVYEFLRREGEKLRALIGA
jgi:2-keto-3-deoxy-L-rhamnonate aldolase RhmA